MKRIIGTSAFAELVLASSIAPSYADADETLTTFAAEAPGNESVITPNYTTRSGTQNCVGGASVAVRGQQERVGDLLTLRVGGIVVYSSRNNLSGTGNSGRTGMHSWQAGSNSLVPSGSYAYCLPGG